MNEAGQGHAQEFWGAVKAARYTFEECSETAPKDSIYCPYAWEEAISPE